MSGLFKHVPNLLTGMRLVCAPALAFLLVSGADRAALGVFAFAGLSDAADGYFAKRFGLATRFGRYLDPAADKLLMLAAFVALAAMGYTPVWLAVLVIARDLAIVAGIAGARAGIASESRTASDREMEHGHPGLLCGVLAFVARFRLALAHAGARSPLA